MTVTTFRLSKALLDRFRTVAEGNQRTVSQELRYVMERHISDGESMAA